MYVENFAGRGASARSLCEAYLEGAPPHASLLLGIEGSGKRTLAHLLAQTLYCVGSASKPCGICPGCRKYRAGSHPDTYTVKEAKRIGVDAVRSLIAALQSAAYEGGWRSVVIEQAGAMTPQAQNSLLKTLEDPPPQTVFLLTAISAAQLLPTIRSRCRIVQLPPLSEAEVERILCERGIADNRAAELAVLSQGSIGRALSMNDDASFWALREKLYSAMEGLRGPADVLGAINLLKEDREEALRIADLLELALHARLQAALMAETMISEGWTSLARLDEVASARQMERVMRMRRMLASNVSWQAALERFLLGYTEELQ